MALVITRKDGEAFQIGDDITVTVYTTNPSPVKITIEAPKELLISREELLDKAVPA